MVIAKCIKHQKELVYSRCTECTSEAIKAFNEEFEGMQVTWGGPPPVQSNIVEVKGQNVEYAHDSTWIEFQVPTALEDEIHEFIKQRIFEFACNCYVCQKQREDAA